MLIQLTNEETKELEYTTTPLTNVTHIPGSVLGDKEAERMMFRSFDITGWAHNGRYYDMEGARSMSNGPLHKQVAAMTELLGFKQNYHIVWSLRNAVWGLQLDELKFVLYICTEGTKIQIDSRKDVDAERIIDHLYDILITVPEGVTPLNKGYK